MTWAKFGTEFRDECAEIGLSDAAFRTHVEAIQYLYGIESTDMRLQKRLMQRWAGSRDFLAGAAELARVKWWRDDGEAYIVDHHANVIRQSIAAQAKHRDDERERQRRKRAAEARAAAAAAAAAAARGGGVGSDVGTNVGETQTDRQTDIQTGLDDEVSQTWDVSSSWELAPDDDAPDLEALARDGWATPAPEHVAPPPAPAPPSPDDGPPEFAHIRAAAAALGSTFSRRESERPAPVVPPAEPGGIGWDFDPDLYA